MRGLIVLIHSCDAYGFLDADLILKQEGKSYCCGLRLLSHCVKTEKHIVIHSAEQWDYLGDRGVLRLNLNVMEDLQFDAELSLKDLKDFSCVLYLCLGQALLIAIVGLLALSEADLVVLEYRVELLSHVVLETVVVGSTHAFRKEVVLPAS